MSQKNKVTKYSIDVDELYPYWTYSTKSHLSEVLVDISDSEIKWLDNTMNEFKKAQDFLEALYREKYVPFKPEVQIQSSPTIMSEKTKQKYREQAMQNCGFFGIRRFNEKD